MFSLGFIAVDGGVLEFTLLDNFISLWVKKIIIFSANSNAPTAYQNAWVFSLYYGARLT